MSYILPCEAYKLVVPPMSHFYFEKTHGKGVPNPTPETPCLCELITPKALLLDNPDLDYSPPPPPRTPEHRLWAAVLADAILCYYGHPAAHMGSPKRFIAHRSAKEYTKAYSYLFLDNRPESKPGSFRYICSLFGLDPTITRQLLWLTKLNHSWSTVKKQATRKKEEHAY